MNKKSKLTKLTTTIAIVCLLLALLLKLIIWIFKNNIPQLYFDILHLIELILLLLVTLSFLILPLISSLYSPIKDSMKNLRSCDDELFDELDGYKKHWEENDNYYINRIKIINSFYAKGGKIDTLVKNKEIKRLFIRADYLSKHLSLFDDFSSNFQAFGISIVAALLMQITNEANSNPFIVIFSAIIIFISLFAIPLMKYQERGQSSSYTHMIDEYELGLLKQKIYELEQEIVCTNNDLDVLKMQKVIYSELNKLRKKTWFWNRKRKKEIIQDIITVENLNLCLGSYPYYIKKQINVNNNVCYLVYKKNLTKPNHRQLNNKLNRKKINHKKINRNFNSLVFKNNDYAVLYDILKKYNLILNLN